MSVEESKKNLNSLPHNLVLKNRSMLQISGVKDIENFNDQTITVYTSEEGLAVTGENLHIKKLNLEQGELCITGRILGLNYTNGEKHQKANKSFFSKIFK